MTGIATTFVPPAYATLSARHPSSLPSTSPSHSHTTKNRQDRQKCPSHPAPNPRNAAEMATGAPMATLHTPQQQQHRQRTTSHVADPGRNGNAPIPRHRDTLPSQHSISGKIGKNDPHTPRGKSKIGRIGTSVAAQKVKIRQKRQPTHGAHREKRQKRQHLAPVLPSAPVLLHPVGARYIAPAPPRPSPLENAARMAIPLTSKMRNPAETASLIAANTKIRHDRQKRQYPPPQPAHPARDYPWPSGHDLHVRQIRQDRQKNSAQLRPPPFPPCFISSLRLRPPLVHSAHLRVTRLPSPSAPPHPMLQCQLTRAGTAARAISGRSRPR